MSNSTRLIFLPGLGADARMYAPQRAVFPNLEVPAWLEPRRNEILADYASRMADKIDITSPLVLGGSSFGGPVALEMAKRLRPAAVFLIGSFRSPRSIPLAFRCAAKIGAYTKGPLLSAMHALSCRSTFMFGPLDTPSREILVAMMRASDPRFVQWGGSALGGWSGAEDLPIPVHHIHGGSDRIIPCHRVQAEVIVPGAGHLLNMTHANEVNRFISDRLASCIRTAIR